MMLSKSCNTQLIATEPELQISITKTKYLVISGFACIVNVSGLVQFLG